MKNRSTALPVVGLLFLIVTACSPEPVLRLSVDNEHEPDVMMYGGMEYLLSEQDNSSVLIAYYRHLGNRVIMDLEVTNYGEEIVRFDPGKDITFEAIGLNFNFDEEVRQGEWVEELLAEKGAYDPEETILEIDKDQSRAVARERTNMLLSGITEGVGAAAAISSDDQSREARSLREEQRNRRAINRAERRENFYRTVSSLNSSRNYWEVEAVRITDLVEGDVVSGEISLPVYPDARILEINVAVGEEIHNFRYVQRKHDP
ncbi:MAG: hypothetical protein JJU46_09860 [Balneolaceae bacterium]|nr:hypothetical protein [Balneolaceae bacterium]MCH8547765.1 hypothetical protein [Balneolaceae bacterium]